MADCTQATTNAIEAIIQSRALACQPNLEQALYELLSQLTKHYINYKNGQSCCSYVPQPVCDPIIIGLFNEDGLRATEEVVEEFVIELLWTLDEGKATPLAIGVLQRITRDIYRQDYFGLEAIRAGRILGILRCAEMELHDRDPLCRRSPQGRTDP